MKQIRDHLWYPINLGHPGSCNNGSPYVSYDYGWLCIPRLWITLYSLTNEHPVSWTMDHPVY